MKNNSKTSPHKLDGFAHSTTPSSQQKLVVASLNEEGAIIENEATACNEPG